ARNGLLEHGAYWINWRADADVYKRNTYRIQIRANGMTRQYEATNGYPGAVRSLMLLVTAVRLPISQNPGTTVVGAAMPMTQPMRGPGDFPDNGNIIR